MIKIKLPFPKAAKSSEQVSNSRHKNFQVALIGNPNCGKTTIFNNLTGSNQKVGNWPGVTIEKKTGQYHYQNNKDNKVTITDLPGLYSISPAPHNNSLDQEITNDFIKNTPCDLYINILDASNLKRNLFLTIQLRELRLPCLVIINMIDKASNNNLNLDLTNLAQNLSQYLNCPVITTSSTKDIKSSITKIKDSINNLVNNSASTAINNTISHTSISNNINIALDREPVSSFNLDTEYQILNNIVIDFSATLLAQKNLSFFNKLNNFNSADTFGLALELIESNKSYEEPLSNNQELKCKLELAKKQVQEAYQEDPDIVIADLRYKIINIICTTLKLIKPEKITLTNTSAITHKQNLTNKIDNIVLNKYLGIPIFLLLLYFVFEVSINFGATLKPLFELPSQAIIKKLIDLIVYNFNITSNTLFIANLTSGLATGVATVASFIPQIAMMFMLLTYLEDSGYMARAAFIMDRLMLAVGLPGKSFLPLIISFGCNVPAILSTRTLHNHQDRILTCLMSPFMSCSARLAIFIVFASAFFPQHPALMVFILYITGIIIALITGLILKKFILFNESSPFILELPSYNLPNFRTLSLTSWQHANGFITRAGKLIIPICIVLQFLNSIQLNGQWVGNDQSQSVLASVSQSITPLLNPIGVTDDNWPATVGLITGSLAKEIVVGTLNTLYSDSTPDTNTTTSLLESHTEIQYIDKLTSKNLIDTLIEAKNESLELITNLFKPSHFYLSNASNSGFSPHSYHRLNQAFPTIWAAFAYCLFVLLYIPCLSTFSTLVKEIGRAWAFASLIWSLDIAYCSASFVYQLSNARTTPFIFLTTVVIIGLSHIGGYYVIKKYAKKRQPTMLSTNNLLINSNQY